MDEIIKGNELIVKFMGAVDLYDKKYTEPAFKYTDRQKKFLIGWEVKQSELLYHSSWNQLMPVLDKIESDTQYSTLIISSGVDEYQCRIGIGWLIQISTSKIECVWLCCVEFIKWYNKTYQPPTEMKFHESGNKGIIDTIINA